MRYLIDTHILIWIFSDNEKISQNIKNILKDRENDIYVLSLTFWEIAIKTNLGKFKFENFDLSLLTNLTEQAGINILNISANDFISYSTLPKHPIHKDPFDRMIIQYSILNNIILLSQDNYFEDYKQYGLKLIN